MFKYIQQVAPDSFQVSGLVSLETVVDYRNALVDIIASNSADSVGIDLQNLEIKGSAILTLLISLVRESRKLEKEVVFRHCPESILAIALACGVSEILELT